MHCPACHSVLTECRAGSVLVDVCQGGCGGIWFDAFELQRTGQEPEPATDFLLRVQRDPAVQVDPFLKRNCPRCAEVKLKRRFFSPKRQVEIDECPGCGGLWLDAGELWKIREEIEESKVLAESSSGELNSAVIRYLYRSRLEARGEL